MPGAQGVVLVEMVELDIMSKLDLVAVYPWCDLQSWRSNRVVLWHFSSFCIFPSSRSMNQRSYPLVAHHFAFNIHC